MQHYTKQTRNWNPMDFESWDSNWLKHQRKMASNLNKYGITQNENKRSKKIFQNNAIGNYHKWITYPTRTWFI